MKKRKAEEVTLKEFLAEVRKDNGIKRNYMLADLAGINRGNFSTITGRGDMKLSQLEKIMAAMDEPIVLETNSGRRFKIITNK